MIHIKKLLVIDDEKDIRDIIKIYFEDNGYQVIEASNAKEGEIKLMQMPDIILLDIIMPDIDGIQFCQKVRESLLCPIIFLSAKVDENSKLMGLAKGGDDYITKPFSIRELYARVCAHLRRESRPRNHLTRVYYNKFWIDYMAKVCGVDNDIIELTKKEFGIIELLSQNSGRVFSHEQIYEAIWGYDALGDANSAVTEHIKRIRKKFNIYGQNKLIETVWGLGYRWKLNQNI